MTQPPTQPRLAWACRKACEFIIAQPVASLPADPARLIRRNRWGLVSYGELAARVGVPPAEVAASLPGRDGCTLVNGRGPKCIAYNAAVATPARVAFTLFHEMGHIWLRRFSDFDASPLPFGDGTALGAGLAPALEEEASCFAANVMAPAVVLELCGLDTPALVSAVCGLSTEAARRRLRELKGREPCELDAAVRDTLLGFIRRNTRPRVYAGAGSEV